MLFRSLATHGSSAAALRAGAIHGYTTSFIFAAIMLGLAAVTAFTLVRATKSDVPATSRPSFRSRPRPEEAAQRWCGSEWSQSASRVRSAVSRMSGWSSMAW